MAATDGPGTIHQHPLAYLIGLHGQALARAFAGEHGREFTLARIAEVRSLLERHEELGDGWDVDPVPVSTGYDRWAPTYDGDNPFFAMDEAELLPVLDTIAPGRAVDAACGTGRYAVHLAARGHEVHGVDVSPGMLEVARNRVPATAFSLGDVDALPVETGSVDVVVNTLALCHVARLGPAYAEAARVLRPGGHLLVSDTCGYFPGSALSPFLAEDARGRTGYVPTWSHGTGDHLRAALDHGFTVEDFAEPVTPTHDRPEDEVPVPLVTGEPAAIWDLHPWAPAATHAARDDRAALVTWHLRRS